MHITRRDWWLGVALLTLALLARAVFPQYEWREAFGGRALIRIDRWTGHAELGRWEHREWTASLTDREADALATQLANEHP